MSDIDKDLTWQDVKDLANLLNEEQLKQPVRFWEENHGGKVLDVNILDEDYVSDGDTYGPKSEMDPAMVDEDEPIVPKGTVMIWLP